MNAMTKKVGLLGVVVACAVGAGFAARPRVTPALLPPSTVAPVAPRLAGERCVFPVGSQFHYSLDVDSKGTLQLGPSELAPGEVQVGLAARLAFETLEAGADAAVLLARFTDAHSSGGVDAAALQKSCFLVEIDHACRLTKFARPSPVERTAARVQQSLLWDLQFQLGSGAFEFENGNGIATATMAQAGSRIERTMEGYRSVWLPQQAVKTTGTLVAQFGDGPWFERLDATEVYSTTNLSSRSRVSMVSIQGETGQFSAAERDLNQYVWEDLLPSFGESAVLHRPVTSFDVKRRERVAKWEAQQAVDDLVGKVGRGAGVQATWQDLSAYLEVHPEAIGTVLAQYQAQKRDWPDRAAGDFFLALGKARVPEARDALLAIKRDDEAMVADRVRSLFALVNREDVGVEFARELAADVAARQGATERTKRFVGGEMLLALSSMSGMHSDDEAVREVSRGAVKSALINGTGDQLRLAVAFRAVGNMGDPSMVPFALERARLGDVSTRVAAANVFRRVPPKASEATELQALAEASEPMVKGALYNVIERQHYDAKVGASRALVEQALVDLPTTRALVTRKSIIRLLARSEGSQDPRVREALKAQAKYERAHHTQLLNEFAGILTREEIAEVLQ